MSDSYMFGDFEDDDADELLPIEALGELTDEEQQMLEELQSRYDVVADIEDPLERKVAAKALIRELNGEE